MLPTTAAILRVAEWLTSTPHTIGSSALSALPQSKGPPGSFWFTPPALELIDSTRLRRYAGFAPPPPPPPLLPLLLLLLAGAVRPAVGMPALLATMH